MSLFLVELVHFKKLAEKTCSYHTIVEAETQNGFLCGQFHHVTKGAFVISEEAIASFSFP